MSKTTIINRADLKKLAKQSENGWVELSRVRIIDTDKEAEMIISASINAMDEVVLALHEESDSPENEERRIKLITCWKATGGKQK